MAILKVVDYKRSDFDTLREVTADCQDPVKCRIGFFTLCISRYPLKAFAVNKYLNKQKLNDHLFEEFIISMEAEWPERQVKRFRYEDQMEFLLQAAMAFWRDQGYQSFGTIHCNTAHPHIHLVLDPCNIRTGKQLPPSSEILCGFKDALTNRMMKLGLGEGIVQDEPVIHISEEMRAEDDPTILPNYAALDLGRPNAMPMFYGYLVPQLPREMACPVGKPQGREMCRLVDHATSCD